MLIVCQSRLHTKSELTISDESKIGTTLDDVKFKQDVRTLTGNEHTFKLGNLDTTFRYAMQNRIRRNASYAMLIHI